MAGIVNLRRARKAATRAAARKAGDANAARHGRSKVEKAIEEARAEKAARTLKGHRRERPDGTPEG